METLYTYIDTAFAKVLIAQTEAGITHIRFMHRPTAEPPRPDWRYTDTLPGDAATQVQSYFAGERFVFDVPLAPEGTPFQQSVWQALLTIPYGETCSYADIATTLNKPKAVRAVGAANGRNPIPIIIPCHRVIGSNGRLTGYAGGLDTKSYLLQLEQAHRPAAGTQFGLFAS